MDFREIGGEAAGLGVHKVVDAALTIERDVFRAMQRHRRKTHQFKQGAKLLRLRMGEFDEFETVRAHRVEGLHHWVS